MRGVHSRGLSDLGFVGDYVTWGRPRSFSIGLPDVFTSWPLSSMGWTCEDDARRRTPSEIRTTSEIRTRGSEMCS